MLKPAINELIRKDQSRYSLVVGTAKRAREIVEEADSNGTVLYEKAVKMAVRDISNGVISIYDQSCGDDVPTQNYRVVSEETAVWSVQEDVIEDTIESSREESEE